MTQVGGIVLAGGRSARMGLDKALLDWHGTPLVVHVADVLRDALDGPLVVVHAEGQELPPLRGVELACDAVPARGPLEGLRAGLAALDGRVDAAFVTAVDVPLLERRLVGLLSRSLADADVALAELEHDRPPLPGVFRITLLPVVDRLLADGRRALRDLLACAAVVTVPEQAVREADPGLGSFRPLNTPEELDALRQGGLGA